MSLVSSLLSKLQPQMVVQAEMTSAPRYTRSEEKSTGRDRGLARAQAVRRNGWDNLLTQESAVPRLLAQKKIRSNLGEA